MSVLRRDSYVCHYCGFLGDSQSLVAEHKIPVSKGGPDTEENLVASCVPCNYKKGTMDYEDFVAGKPRIRKVRLTIYISHELFNELWMERARTGKSVSEIAEELMLDGITASA